MDRIDNILIFNNKVIDVKTGTLKLNDVYISDRGEILFTGDVIISQDAYSNLTMRFRHNNKTLFSISLSTYSTTENNKSTSKREYLIKFLLSTRERPSGIEIEKLRRIARLIEQKIYYLLRLDLNMIPLKDFGETDQETL
jgi:hypothetical protein